MANSGNLTPWKPGQSGNPIGRPPRSRNSFSAAYIRNRAGTDSVQKFIRD